MLAEETTEIAAREQEEIVFEPIVERELEGNETQESVGTDWNSLYGSSSSSESYNSQDVSVYQEATAPGTRAFKIDRNRLRRRKYRKY